MKITRLLALAALSAAALLPARAAAQTDTAGVTVRRGQTSEPTATPTREVPVSAVPRARRSINSITYEEVRTARVSDAHQLIHNLRPSWLRTPRGATSLTNHPDIAVFMNGTRMGSRDALHSIPITAVRTVRLYTATEARQRFGGDTQAGAIEITGP
ncbi:MAG: hypothetical protein ACJ8GN_02415 [Longimicrobiaceae bacterium]